MSDWLAIDFGTSNTAAAYFHDGQAHQIQLEADKETIPTAVFFPQRSGRMEIGAVANAALIEGDEGRYMRALKSVLGTNLMSEQRLLGGRRLDFYDVISAFLGSVKSRAEAATGRTFDHALSGRPVRFHSKHPERNDQALADLTECYMRAGFKAVNFCPEPEAAALSLGHRLENGRYGLVVDIGGGTSDFTVFKAGTEIDIITSFGVRIGGTDFDRVLSYSQVMPHFGRGQRLTRLMAQDTLIAPNHIFHDLSTWEKIPFVYDPASLKLAKELMRDAVEPSKFARLVDVIEYQYGHELAFAVEDAKIACNAEQGPYRAPLNFLSDPMLARITYDDFLTEVDGFKQELQDAMRITIDQAGLTPDQVQDIVLVGGSSMMGFVIDAINLVFNAPRLHQDAIFTAIVDGLALRSARIDHSKN